ncbi:hypothetical protein OAA09_00545 [bacterium]|nr:hypothetical protein [bacterium]
MSTTLKSNWIPEICYEEAEDGLTSKIPFIQVPEDEEMPRILFVFESRNTGETEPGLEGEEIPVTEIDLHQYANMAVLKERLSFVEYDNVRFALGLESLKTAAVKGQKITSNIRVAISEDDTDGNALNKTIDSTD